MDAVFALVDELIACIEQNASTDAMRNMATSARARADALRAGAAEPAEEVEPDAGDQAEGDDSDDGNEKAEDAGD